MSVGERVRSLLDQTLNLGGRSAGWGDEMALLGNVPELNSLAVVTVLVELERQFNIVIADDEMDAEVFETVGHLVRFVEGKLGAPV
jgi:acyl carrier protein